MGRLKTLAPRLGSGTTPRGGWAAPHRGSSAARGYGADWRRLREQVLDRDAGLCQPCRRRGVATPGCRTVDHIVPKARGGTDAIGNCQCICEDCHKAKTQAESQGRIWDETVHHLRSAR